VERIACEALGARSLERLERGVKPATRRAERTRDASRATLGGVARRARSVREDALRLAVILHAAQGSIE
jgi:hypothetical protein